MSPRIGLVVSGGGAKGAYAAGALKYLVSEGCTRFDLYAGTSTGALVTTLALAGGYDELEYRYTTSGISDFTEPLDLQGVRERRGLVDSRRFRRTLEEVYTQAVADKVFAASAPQLILTAVQLRTGKLVYFHTGSAGTDAWNESWEVWHRMGPGANAPDPHEQLLQVLEASGSEPVKFPPVKVWREDDWYVDGGVRAYTPIKAALAAGASELFIIMHSPRRENITAEPKKLDSFPGVAGQTLAIVQANASAMDFAQARARAGGVEIENRVVAPQQPIKGLGSGPNVLARGVFDLGFEDAESVWGPLLQQRPELRTQLQGGLRHLRAPLAVRSRPTQRRTRKPQPTAEDRLTAFWTTAKGGKRRKPARKGPPKRSIKEGSQKRAPRKKASKKSREKMVRRGRT